MVGEYCIALPSAGLVWSWVGIAVHLVENCMSQTNVQSPMKDVVIAEPTWAKSDLSQKPEWEFPQEVEGGGILCRHNAREHGYSGVTTPVPMAET